MKSERSTKHFERWRKTQTEAVIMMCYYHQWKWKTSFWKYYHGKQTQINEGYYDISRDEVGAAGFLTTKAGKIRRPFYTTVPPKRAYWETCTTHLTPCATFETKYTFRAVLTENWNLKIYNYLLWSIILVFQFGVFHLKKTQV